MADPFRTNYRELTASEKVNILAIKDHAGGLLNVLRQSCSGRELALAQTKLEECVMWAVKGITA